MSRRLSDWLLAFCGTFGGVLFRPNGAHLHWGLDAGLAVQLVGLFICVWSLSALGRSFGFAAADRGLVRRGPYRVIRHPIYASYVLLQLGYLLQSISLRNALVMLFTSSCNVGRALAEEHLLTNNGPYAACIVPGPLEGASRRLVVLGKTGAESGTSHVEAEHGTLVWSPPSAQDVDCARDHDGNGHPGHPSTETTHSGDVMDRLIKPWVWGF